MDAVLLAVAEICADGHAKRPVAILPEMRIASGDGILLKNPATSFEMWFTGTVDYGVCTYENEDHRGAVFFLSSIPLLCVLSHIQVLQTVF